MLTRQQQAQQLRALIIPYIESNGVERETECRDGTTRRYKEARLGGFVFCYETPSHRNPRPVASCFDEALYFQSNPIEDYALAIKFFDRPDDPATGKKTVMFSACWRSKGETVHITTFAGNESRWYDIVLAAVELAAKRAPSQAPQPMSSDTGDQAGTPSANHVL